MGHTSFVSTSRFFMILHYIITFENINHINTLFQRTVDECLVEIGSYQNDDFNNM